MRALLIMNPRSRSGRGRRLWRFWESRLKAEGIDFDSVPTRRTGHGVELAADSKDYDTVVAVGGDGTIGETLDGVIQSGRSDLRMGVLYAGTSPDFCRFHGIPTDPSAAVETLVAGRSRKVDAARIRHAGPNGAGMSAHFGCGCNIGLGASVARVSNRIRRFAGDRCGTLIAVAHSIAAMRPTDIEITLDGSSQILSGVNNLSILKNPYIASGMRLDLDLRAADGKLVVFAVYGKTRMSLLSVLPGFYSGTAAGRSDVFIRASSRVVVDSSRKSEIEFDGDPRGFLPAEIEVLPAALDLIGASDERA